MRLAKKYKYPRTPHLSNSLGVEEDDIISSSSFVGKEVIATVKMDGECTTLYSDYSHARSMDSKHHPSRSWVKQLQSHIGYKIPEGYRVCGENMYALHQIYYRKLETYFFVYGIYDENNICLSWEDTLMWCEELELKTVPVFYQGIYNSEEIHTAWEAFHPFPTYIRNSDKTNDKLVFPEDFKECGQEGYVVRLKDNFSYGDFGHSVAKYVRNGFKQALKEADIHWATASVYPNSLN